MARSAPNRSSPDDDVGAAAKAGADGGSDRSASQTLRAQIALRELVLRGELSPGDRVSELQMVERLGVSRTPVRTALVRLQDEGLLEPIPSGGFAVKSFTEREVFEAIEIRGTLEGLGARLAAERGVRPSALRKGAEILDAVDEVVRPGSIEIDLSAYVKLNAAFHVLLTELSGSRALARQIERASALPFASPSALVLVQSRAPEAHRILTVAQDQHRCVLVAIKRREGARAEAIMREHARIAHRNLERAFSNQTMLHLVPGSALITKRARGGLTTRQNREDEE